jgi:hypothetical protein
LSDDPQLFAQQLVGLVQDACRDAVREATRTPLASLAEATAKYDSLRASHDALLAAAKRVSATQDEASRRDGDARHAISALRAAIAKAEELQ